MFPHFRCCFRPLPGQRGSLYRYYTAFCRSVTSLFQQICGKCARPFPDTRTRAGAFGGFGEAGDVFRLPPWGKLAWHTPDEG